MYIIVDGYNLIKQIFNVSRVCEKKRDNYVAQLVKKAAAKGHKLVMVFDGGSFNFPQIQDQGKYVLIYSGYRESADDVIKEYVADNRNLELLVVTSDREIRNFAHNLGVDTIDSIGFNKIIENSRPKQASQVVKKNTASIKTSTLENSELDALMMDVDGHIEKNEYQKEDRTSPSQKESKKKKKLRRKIDKL